MVAGEEMGKRWCGRYGGCVQVRLGGFNVVLDLGRGKRMEGEGRM